MKQTRVAILCGEGWKGQVSFPDDIDVRMYESTPRDAGKVAGMMKARSVDAVIVANRTPNHNVISMLPKGTVPVYVWNRGLSSLAENLRALIKDESTSTQRATAIVSPVRPYVRVSEASKHPDRRPPWTDDERAALRLAYENAFDFQRVIDGYLELTSDIDAPVRSQGEIREQVTLFRQGPADDVEYDPFGMFAFLLALAVADSFARAAYRRERSIIQEVIGAIAQTSLVPASDWFAEEAV